MHEKRVELRGRRAGTPRDLGRRQREVVEDEDENVQAADVEEWCAEALGKLLTTPMVAGQLKVALLPDHDEEGDATRCQGQRLQ